MNVEDRVREFEGKWERWKNPRPLGRCTWVMRNGRRCKGLGTPYCPFHRKIADIRSGGR